jgi:hypothetical protein
MSLQHHLNSQAYNKALAHTSKKLLKQADQYTRLSKIANKNNYPKRLQELDAKLTELLDLYRRNPEQAVRYREAIRDSEIIKNLIKTDSINEPEIDRLTSKYL